MSEYKEKQKSRQREDVEGAPAPPEAEAGQAQAVSEETEDLLDEIDEVLEENAETFIANYVQRGGQAVAVKWNELFDWIKREVVPRLPGAETVLGFS